MTGYAGLGQDMAICKSNTAVATGLRPACSRIIIKDNTHWGWRSSQQRASE